MQAKETTVKKIAAEFRRLTGRDASSVYLVRGKRSRMLTYATADGLVYLVGLANGPTVDGRMVIIPVFQLAGKVES
jgi:hypothetical protein